MTTATLSRPRPPIGLDRLRLAGPRLVLLAAIAATTALALAQRYPPTVASRDAPAAAFSAERAMVHVAAIARAPRPAGSPGHGAARAYLLGELRAQGLGPVVQTAAVAQRWPGMEGLGAMRAQNVVVRIPGTASTGAVLLNAHYDSGSTGPGAGDCGSCVGAVLEAVRAVRAGLPLRNDLVVVFADGEENGDLGARAFARHHPWMGDVRAAINFEGQGSTGASVLYYSSLGDAGLVAAYARSPHPRGSSFLSAFMRLLPFRAGCDVEEYVDVGAAGLTFVFNGDTPAYHTALDRPGRLDPRSVQHHGEHALALVRDLGHADLGALDRGGDAVFFNVLPSVLVYYPLGWAVPLAVLSGLAVVVLVAWGLRRRRLTVKGVALGALAGLLTPLAVTSLMTVLWWALRVATPALQVFLVGQYGHAWLLAGFVVLAVALAAVPFVALLRCRTVSDLHAGALVAGVGLLALVTLALPGASYLLAWPVLAGALVLGWLLYGRADDRPWVTAAVFALAAAPAVLLLLPAATYPLPSLLAWVEATTGFPTLGVPMLFVALGVGLATPALTAFGSTAGGRVRWGLVGGVVVVGLLLVGVGVLRSGFGAEQPRPSRIAYELDADTGTAQWVSLDARLDAWTSSFFPIGTDRTGTPSAYRTEAPVFALAAPEAVLLEASAKGDERRYRFRVRSPRGAPILYLEVESTGPVTALAVGGQPFDLRGHRGAAAGRPAVALYAVPPEGYEVTLAVRGGVPARLLLTDEADGLPADTRVTPRPSGTMPAPGFPNDGSRVTSSYTLARP